MGLLLPGLALFLGVHSSRIVAEGWRARSIARIGEPAWKGLYSLLAIAGFVLVVMGYGAARASSPQLWSPPLWTYHLAAALTVPAFVLLASAYLPRNRLRARLGHPMLLGIKLWALAHLVSNGRLVDVVLFGAFLAWAVADFAAARRRDRRDGRRPAPGTLAGDAAAVLVGLALWYGFARWLHPWWIGVAPLASLGAAG